ncbi:unnamed protein product [Rotaria magnacalcarata]|uniref:Uncharacterized protein n=1 Tax=Rotaria magnacalcarata TaxID=392030 RepID=A0A816KV57_9BILA|nr:unnamed protein product [Rotaria magnacalcarata]CAF1673636.1 unnamed protein product [Rotaria magnacalcarata]CAF1931784.1 unnamed protein product [Rotaria magnacalcarata]CAF4461340.1 unnamed protein product [Rotaria magnacalcarata]CAF4463916.1 unnamed protein product [Rotaria magnacalcarata]
MDDDDQLLDNRSVIECINEPNDHKAITSLREWFIWSYLNVIFGSVILDLIAIGCSIRTNELKRKQNYAKASIWSSITLIVNCIATLSGLTFIGYLIIFKFHSI